MQSAVAVRNATVPWHSSPSHPWSWQSQGSDVECTRTVLHACSTQLQLSLRKQRLPMNTSLFVMAVNVITNNLLGLSVYDDIAARH